MSSVQTTNKGQIVNSAKPGDGLAKMIEGMKGEIARALPKHVSPDRMARIVTTAIRTTPRLALSEPVSFVGCVLTLAQLGLEPNTPMGLAYLIPRNNRRRNCVETTIIIGYQGFQDLARRSGMVSGIFAHPVFEADHFRWSLGTDPRIEHEPTDKSRTDQKLVRAAYAVARIRDADPIAEVLTRAQIDARRARSASGDDGPWVTDTIAMIRKTAIRALYPYIPKSAEMAQAQTVDEAAERGRSIATVADGVAAEVLDRLGAPRDEEPSEVDPETGEVVPTQAELDAAAAKTKGGAA